MNREEAIDKLESTSYFNKGGFKYREDVIDDLLDLVNMIGFNSEEAMNTIEFKLENYGYSINKPKRKGKL